MERTVALVFGALAFIVLGVWWMDKNFGPQLSISVVLGVTHLLAFAGGAVLSFAITRGSLGAVNEYAKNDAIVDRFRQQTFKEQARGKSALERAEAQLTVINARRVDKMAQDRAKLIIDADRQSRQPKDTWTWEPEDDEGEYQ